MTRWQDYEAKTDNVKPWEELIINSGWIVKRVDVNKFKWVPWERWPAGEKWEPFKFSDFTEEQLKNLKWVWIKKITQRKNWKITTVTVELTDSSSFDFEISDWRDWAGSGDMISSNNLSDLIDKIEARKNLEVYSKTESDKKISDEIKKIPKPDLTKLYKNEWDKVLLLSNVNLDTVTIPWFYRVDWGVNKPEWSSHWLYLEVFSHDNSHTLQRATELDWADCRVYIRHKYWTAQWDRWSPWRRINSQLLWGWIAKNTHNWTLVIGNIDNNTWITEVENWGIGFYVKWEYVAVISVDWVFSRKPQANWGEWYVRKDYVDNNCVRCVFKTENLNIQNWNRITLNHNLNIQQWELEEWRYYALIFSSIPDWGSQYYSSFPTQYLNKWHWTQWGWVINWTENTISLSGPNTIRRIMIFKTF